MALTVGSRLGHYDVTALIGEGGMGQVYPKNFCNLGISSREVSYGLSPNSYLERYATLQIFFGGC